MTIPCPGPSCDRPRPGDRQVCGACEADLARALADVPWLARQLDIVLARQGSRPGGGGKRTGIPLPYDPRATEAAFVLRSALVGWVRLLVEARPEEEPADDLPAIGRWLAARLERLVMHPAAEEAVDEICSAVRSATRLVDRPRDLGYAGPCEAVVEGEVCRTDLYARPDASRVTCRQCGAIYDVAERRAWMLDSLNDALFVAAQAAHVLTSLGEDCTAERIRQWAHRGRIAQHGTDQQSRPLYRVGEIRVLLFFAERRARAGDTKRERMSA